MSSSRRLKMAAVPFSLPLLLMLVLVVAKAGVAPASALDVGVVDVMQVMKIAAGIIFKAWDVVRDLPDAGTVLKYPMLSSGQREVLSSLRQVSDQIMHSEQAHSQHISVATDAINNFVQGNVKMSLRFVEVNDIMNDISARFKEMQQYDDHKDQLERVTLLTFARSVALPSVDSVYHLLERLYTGVLGSSREKNLFDLLIQNYEVSTEHHCQLFQSAQQLLYTLYTDIALTELKGYTMMEFSWMILRLNGEGNFTREAMLMRQDYHERITKMVRLLREVMRRADRTVWRCDPVEHRLGVTFDQVTRLLQGYIENEVEMSNSHECWNTCGDYSVEVNSEGCFKDKFCSKQERCTGKLYNCSFIGSDMDVCQSGRGSPRRYEFIKYHKVGNYGQEKHCNRQMTEVDSWWRYLFWHCSYCFCFCDDKNSPKTDRYFNLRETTSNTKDNRVVTGLRFVKMNRIFHLQIQEGQLLPLGAVNSSSLLWKPVDNYTLHSRGIIKGRDYHSLKYAVNSIDLDDVHTDDPTFVITGVRFRVLGTHLNLEARLSEYDYTTGKLLNPEVNSFWKSNDNTEVSGQKRNKIQINDEGLPTLSPVKSVPISGHNQYMEFVPSSVLRDLAQSTLPFIDIQAVTCDPPVPLSGIGIFYKGKPLNGGFVAPKLFTYDFGPHIQEPEIDTIKEENSVYNTIQLIDNDSNKSNEV